MGNIFSRRLLSKSLIDIDIRDTRPEPIAEDKDIYHVCVKLLSHCEHNLKRLKTYKGSSEKIRQAISNPSADVELEAWNAIRPAIIFLRNCYYTCRFIEYVLPSLIQRLCTPIIREGIDRSQALARIVIDIMDYIFIFDDLKLENPEIQNDFSYYRRAKARFGFGNKAQKDSIIRDDLANQMSFFFAVPNPMFCSVLFRLQNPGQAITKSTKLQVPIELLPQDVDEEHEQTYSVTMDEVVSALKVHGEGTNAMTVEDEQACLETICNSLIDELMRRPIESDDQTLVAIRAMTIIVLFYDHLSNTSVFRRRSPIHIKQVIKLIWEQDVELCDKCMHLFVYNSRNLEKGSRQIRRLLEDSLVSATE